MRARARRRRRCFGVGVCGNACSELRGRENARDKKRLGALRHMRFGAFSLALSALRANALWWRCANSRRHSCAGACGSLGNVFFARLQRTFALADASLACDCYSHSESESLVP